MGVMAPGSAPGFEVWWMGDAGVGLAWGSGAAGSLPGALGVAVGGGGTGHGAIPRVTLPSAFTRMTTGARPPRW